MHKYVRDWAGFAQQGFPSIHYIIYIVSKFLHCFWSVLIIYQLGKERAKYVKGLSTKNTKYGPKDVDKMLSKKDREKILGAMRSRKYRKILSDEKKNEKR